MTKVLLVHHDEPVLSGEPHPVVWSDSLLPALGLGSFSPPLSKGESLLLVTIWPICNEHKPINTERFEGTASFRSKRRSLCHSIVVAISLRSQMLYPVELRAPPRRAVNVRVQHNRVNQQQTEQIPNIERSSPNLKFESYVLHSTFDVGR
jgi:hypothetical protein